MPKAHFLPMVKSTLVSGLETAQSGTGISDWYDGGGSAADSENDGG